MNKINNQFNYIIKKCKYTDVCQCFISEKVIVFHPYVCKNLQVKLQKINARIDMLSKMVNCIIKHIIIYYSKTYNQQKFILQRKQIKIFLKKTKTKKKL